MEIKQLHYFLAVAEELNFHKAAKRLFMSQPPLSRQIRLLEERLEVQLFNRVKKRITLTEAGEALVLDARAIIDMTILVEQKIKNLGDGERGTLNISCVISGLMKFLPSWIKEFKKTYPRIDIILSETSGNKNIINNLINKKTDISFTYGIERDLRIKSKVIYSENIYYALPANHRFKGKQRLSLKMLKNEDFIFFPRELDPKWYDTFQEQCKRNGFKPRIAHHAHPMQHRLNMVSGGMGITFVAESLIQFKTPGVIYKLPSEDEEMIIPVTLSYRKDLQSKIVKNFLSQFDLLE